MAVSMRQRRLARPGSPSISAEPTATTTTTTRTRYPAAPASPSSPERASSAHPTYEEIAAKYERTLRLYHPLRAPPPPWWHRGLLLLLLVAASSWALQTRLRLLSRPPSSAYSDLAPLDPPSRTSSRGAPPRLYLVDATRQGVTLTSPSSSSWWWSWIWTSPRRPPRADTEPTLPHPTDSGPEAPAAPGTSSSAPRPRNAHDEVDGLGEHYEPPLASWWEEVAMSLGLLGDWIEDDVL